MTPAFSLDHDAPDTAAAGCAELRLHSEVKRLTAECDSLVQQVVQSFEELSLFRRMGEHLVLSETTGNAFDLCEAVLPDLCGIMEAESLLLIVVDDDATAPGGSPKNTFRWYGPELLTAQQRERFLACESGHAAQRALVRNSLAGRDQACPRPGLDSYVLVEIRSQGRLAGWLAAFNRADQVATAGTCSAGGFTSAEVGLLSTVASMLAAHFHNVALLRQKEAMFTAMVRTLVNAIDARDPYTCGHSERVALTACRLAEAAGLGPAECERLYLSGLIHDLGKIGIPDSLLRKDGGLTEREYGLLKTHPDAAWSMLHDLPALRDLLPGMLHHHERFDGQGYPDGLAGEAIPIDARILAICDTYDAMTSDRPYRRGLPQDEAERRLQAGAGSQWDPQLIAKFFEIMPDAIAIRHDYMPRIRMDRKRTKKSKRGRS